MRADQLHRKIGTKNAIAAAKAIAAAIAVASSEKGFRTSKKDGQEAPTLVKIGMGGGSQETLKFSTSEAKGLKLIITALVVNGSIAEEVPEDRYYNESRKRRTLYSGSQQNDACMPWFLFFFLLMSCRVLKGGGVKGRG